MMPFWSACRAHGRGRKQGPAALRLRCGCWGPGHCCVFQRVVEIEGVGP